MFVLRCVLLGLNVFLFFRWEESAPDELLGAAVLRPAEGGLHQGEKPQNLGLRVGMDIIDL